MRALKRFGSFAPLPLWLFWIAGAVVVVYGALLRDYSPPETRFLVSTGLTLEAWHGTHVDRVLQRFNDGSSVLDPASASGGRRLAYVRYTAVTREQNGSTDFGADLWIAAPDGSDARIAVRHSVLGETIETPVWLPGDKQLAYSIVTPKDDGTADARIEAIDIETGVRQRFLNQADQPALTPDGQRLIVRLSDFRPGRTGETPVLYSLATGEWTDLPDYHANLVFIGTFTYSPDGSKIAFGGTDPSLVAPYGGGRDVLLKRFLHPFLQDIWLMGADGSNPVRIADLAVDKPSLVWSADGMWLYAMTNLGFWRIDPRTGYYEKIGPGGTNIRIRTLPSQP